MSRAFVKEPDGDVPAERFDLPESPHPNYVTPRGLKELEARLAEAIGEKRRLDAAGETPEAKVALDEVERRIRYFSHRIENAIPVDPGAQPRDKVAFGATVRVADDQDQEREFTIVGEDEADAANGLVSWISPLARALDGAKVGQTVTWKRPVGDLELEVLAIRYDAG